MAVDAGAGARPVRFVALPLEVLDALAAGDAERAAAALPVELTPFVHDERWLWGIRSDQLKQSPQDADWVARLAVVDGRVVGHGGFHAAPDEDGLVEVGYSVDPQHRRRGHATEILRALLDRAAREEQVRRVRASVSPDNEASLALLRGFGFSLVGEQWDEDDGLELIFERDASPEA